MPVIGLEAEFKVFLDGEEVEPEAIWRTPAGFIERPLLKRASKSSQLPTGGAVYFDGGVIEVVTPVIEIAPQCTARAVRSLWEQIGFVREELDGWERRDGHRVRLQAFSCHVNISFELPREARNRNRTVQKLALLLAHLLPAPVIVAGANRKSTAIGVRPRRERIEITFDFTPDPGLMAATVALMVGIVRDVIEWPSYRLDAASHIPRIADVAPRKHPTRNGWVVRDYLFANNPFSGDVDAPVWPTTIGVKMSLRQIALLNAIAFRDSIRRVADPFSYHLLFAILRGEMPSLLDLPDRPAAYDDVGRMTRWGSSLPELENFAALMGNIGPLRRRSDVDQKLAPPWSGEAVDRRRASRDGAERRRNPPTSSRRLTRSLYEKVFLHLGRRDRLRIGDRILVPVRAQGWYHAIFATAHGEEQMFSIDQLASQSGKWLNASD